MKSFGLDFYGGMLWSNNELRDTILNSNNPIAFNELQYDKESFIIGPPRPVAYNLFDAFKIPYTGKNMITGWWGEIGSFGSVLSNPASKAKSRLDVDVWLSTQPCGKTANDIFAGLKTGDGKAVSGGISGLALPLPPTIYLNYWGHNMGLPQSALVADDWHCGFIVYYQ